MLFGVQSQSQLLPAAAGGAVEYLAAASGYAHFDSSDSVTHPAGVQEGDLMVACTMNTNTDSINLPSGWTAIIDNASDRHYALIAAKIAEASDVDGSTTFTKPSSGGFSWVITAWRNAAMPTVSNNFNSPSSQGSDVDAPSTSGGLSDALIAGCIDEGSTSQTISSGPDGMTLAAEEDGDGRAVMNSVWYENPVQSEPTGARTFIASTFLQPGCRAYQVRIPQAS